MFFLKFLYFIREYFAKKIDKNKVGYGPEFLFLVIYL